MPSAEVLIRLVGVEKTYAGTRGQPVRALDPVNLGITAREFVSVVGPSGCGKTTVLRIMGGLIAPSGGQVLLGGTPVTAPRRDIGIVFQQSVLFPWRTVLANALLPADIQKMPRKAAEERARGLLALVGLAGFEDRYPWELSGGMQQRVAITRALLQDPALLLMDEPFGALDALTREQMSLELQRIWMESRKTVFFITHSIQESVFLSDRVVVMTPRPGRVAGVVAVPFPRPRGLDLMADPEFGRIANHIRRLLAGS